MCLWCPSLSSVLFVEYHFPVTTGQTACHAQEVMRVASRKMAGTGGEGWREETTWLNMCCACLGTLNT